MSSEARREAIAIIERGLAAYRNDDESVVTDAAERLVDELLETHAISRRAPRVLRRSLDVPPPPKLPGQRHDEPTRV